jgi:hypothetical protein
MFLGTTSNIDTQLFESSILPNFIYIWKWNWFLSDFFLSLQPFILWKNLYEAIISLVEYLINIYKNHLKLLLYQSLSISELCNFDILYCSVWISCSTYLLDIINQKSLFIVWRYVYQTDLVSVITNFIIRIYCNSDTSEYSGRKLLFSYIIFITFFFNYLFLPHI